MEFTTLLLLIAVMLSMSVPNVFKKKFTKGTPVFFSFVNICTALLFFVVSFLVQNGFNFDVDANILKYAIPFGLCFSLANLCGMMAFRTGDLSITGLLISFSLILPTLYGVIFLNDPVGILFWIGLALFLVCLVLTNVKFLDKNKDNKVKKGISFKWVFFVTVATVANGCGTICQTMQQKAYGGTKGNELMIIALSMVCLVFLTVSLLTERKKIKEAYKSAIVWAVPTGILTGLLNFLVIIFTGQNLLPVAIFFPLVSAGSLIATFIMGYFIYKEKYDWLQYIGIVCGFAAVILLKL